MQGWVQSLLSAKKWGGDHANWGNGEYTHRVIPIKSIHIDFKPLSCFEKARKHLLRDPLFRMQVSWEKHRCTSGMWIFLLITPISAGESGSKFKGSWALEHTTVLFSLNGKSSSCPTGSTRYYVSQISYSLPFSTPSPFFYWAFSSLPSNLKVRYSLLLPSFPTISRIHLKCATAML